MRICSSCGTPVNDDKLKECPNCKEVLKKNMQKKENSDYWENYGKKDRTYDKMPMKWYYFLIYFGLFAGAVFNVFNGISFLSGSVWEVQLNNEVTAEMIYSFYGNSLMYLDKVYAIALIGLAALQIVARQGLAHHKSYGPKFLYLVYGLNMLFFLIYNIIAMIIIGNDAQIMYDIVKQFILRFVLLGVNVTYFSNRKHLFND